MQCFADAGDFLAQTERQRAWVMQLQLQDPGFGVPHPQRGKCKMRGEMRVPTLGREGRTQGGGTSE